MAETITKELNHLVALSIKGNQKAQFDLYHTFSKAMYNTCLRFLNDTRDAEETLQNAFVLIFKNLETFRGESTLGAWIKKIVVYQCINKLKEKNLIFQDLNESHYELPNEDKNHEDNLEYTLTMIPKITEAILTLPTGYRTISMMYLFEGFDHEEISKILNISVNTTKSQLSRAKQKIREKLTNE